MNGPSTTPRVRIRDLVLYFVRLGTLGFGGPVALCGQMERELVEDRRWLTKDEMREAIGVCQSLPGPLAIQVGIFISYIRGGFWGAWAGGWAFILPNFVIVVALASLYVHFGGLSLVTAIFYGVSPAVIALILHSCYRLAKLGMEDWLQWVIVGLCFVVTVAVQAEVALLFVGAGIVGILYYGSLFRARAASSSLPLLAVLPVGAPVAPTIQGPIFGKLLLFFLKAGSLTFGSGVRTKHTFSGVETLLEADTVVLAFGGKANDGLFHALSGKVPELKLIGDACSPRRIHDALLEGTRMARAL